MTGIEAAAGPVISSVATPAVSYVSRMVTSSINLEEQYKRLEEDMHRLLFDKKDKESEVCRNRQKYTTSRYKLWISMVSNAARDFDKLRGEYLVTKSLGRHHIRKKSRMSEKIDKMSNHVCQLLNHGNDLKDFLVDKQPGSVSMDQSHVPPIRGYRTLQTALEEILDHLKNNSIRVIGVYGTKGVGKTTIMQNLLEHIKEEEVGPSKLFDKVVFVKVANEAHKLQEKIAKRMMLDIEAIKDDQEKISQELERKKYLLILDEVEKDFDLKRSGITIVGNGSKMVIATQFLQVCKLNGDVVKVVKVNPLSEEEARKMFKDTVCASSTGCTAMVDPDVQLVAELVCKRCSCLPLLIRLTANSFRLKESLCSWRDGLEDLKIWPEFENDGLGELYSFSESCYQELKEKNMMECFLHTSLYPADKKVYIDYLVECWAAQGLLGDILNDKRKHPYRKARDCGIGILEKLTNVSLLEKGDSMTYVWMNDFTRQLAWYISSKDPYCSIYLQHTEGFSNLPNSISQPRWVSMIGTESLNSLENQDLISVSMIGTESLNSLENQDLSKLLMLLLQKTSDLETIPESLLEKISTLLVLDLYSTNIKWLPSSLSKLTDLRALFLNRCVPLKSLPSGIKSLELLEVLDIRDTNVIFIPPYIGSLTNLRCLRIPFFATDKRKVQNVYVISKLHKLEELTIQVNSYTEWCKYAENVLKQVASLKNLTSLTCCLPFSKNDQDFNSKIELWTSYAPKVIQFSCGMQKLKTASNMSV